MMQPETGILFFQLYALALFTIKHGGSLEEEFPKAVFVLTPCSMDGFNLLDHQEFSHVTVGSTTVEESKIYYESMEYTYATVVLRRHFKLAVQNAKEVF